MLEPFSLFGKQDEQESFKLASSKDGTWPASSYGYRLTALNHGRPTLTYASQSDPPMKVRAAGAQLLKWTNGGQP